MFAQIKRRGSGKIRLLLVHSHGPDWGNTNFESLLLALQKLTISAKQIYKWFTNAPWFVFNFPVWLLVEQFYFSRTSETRLVLIGRHSNQRSIDWYERKQSGRLKPVIPKRLLPLLPVDWPCSNPSKTRSINWPRFLSMLMLWCYPPSHGRELLTT